MYEQHSHPTLGLWQACTVFGAHCSLVHKMMVFLVMIILVCYKGLTFVTCLINGISICRVPRGPDPTPHPKDLWQMHCVWSSLITGPENEGVSRNNFNAIESYPNLNKVDQFSTIGSSTILGLNVSTSHIMEMGCRQCLPLSVVKLKGKQCRKSNCLNGVVDMFSHGLSNNP